MGCINNVKIRNKNCIIKPNQMTNNEKRNKLSLATCEHISSKKINEEKNLTDISQNLKSMIDNNPLPFVKIKIIKKHHL